jgi:ribonuclease VapC
MSAANVVETGTVLVGRRLHDPAAALADLDRLLEVARIDIAPVDAAQARIALAARVRFGRGMGHGGLLNYGDTFAYALARSLDASLLYVGNDFRSTDIRPAIGPA